MSYLEQPIITHVIPADSNELASHADIEFETDKVSEINTRLVHGKVHVAGVEVPFTIEQPKHVVDPVVMTYVNGYCASKPAYRNIRTAFAQNGKPSLTMQPVRAKLLIHPQYYVTPESVHTAAITAVLDAANDRLIDTTLCDVSGHSMGGFIATDLLLHSDIERFRTLTLVGSAGLDAHTLRTMLWRLPKFLTKELIPSLPDLYNQHPKSFLHNELRHIGVNPFFTVAEGLRAAQCDIRERVRYIGSLGVKTAALQFNKDEFFPEQGVRSRSQYLFNHYEVYEDPRANHLAPQRDPEGVAKAQIRIIKNLVEVSNVAA